MYGEGVGSEEAEVKVTLLIPMGKLIVCIRPILCIVNLNYTHQEQWAAKVQRLETNSRSFASVVVRSTDRSVNPDMHVFDGGRKAEHPEKTSTGTRTTYKLHRKDLDSNSGPSCCEATVLSHHDAQKFNKLYIN